MSSHGTLHRQFDRTTVRAVKLDLHAEMMRVLRGAARQTYKAVNLARMYSGHLQDAARYYWHMYSGTNAPLTPT